jgi:hypothetical protein
VASNSLTFARSESDTVFGLLFDFAAQLVMVGMVLGTLGPVQAWWRVSKRTFC